ncbi:trypsin-like peptidase domain-containing protein [Brevundimonas lenta]|uniref:S1-C subfamily serine protease n=1 Tax=Brevundimonas lenta TaxID=424796 RepID=A0A7W6JC27_9CAUL|nr:trypsin-like peptidase domain-containing protein [Brevundimonas lenta]MBB4081421.1 S1-C subfamily serine protease [Brevundimonas lenta]
MESLDPSVLRVVVFSGDELISLGTGVVVGRGDGGVYVATNYHVIANGSANGIRVLAPARRSAGGEDEDGRPAVIEREAEYRRSDTGRSKDIAILFVPGLDRPPVIVLDGALNRDAEVRALGYPYTDLALWRRVQSRPWITNGRVSALERESINSGGSAVDQIAHTADLNSGMSGGPLVDHCGRLVGLNTAVLEGANGANIAIGVADVRRLARELGAQIETDGGACGVEPIAATVAPVSADTPTKTRKGGGFPGWALFAGISALGLLALGGGLVIFLRRRGHRAGGAQPCPSGLLFVGVGDAVRDQQRAIGRAELEAGAELGRQPGFGSDSTSRRHAIVKWIGQGFVVRDVGSMNGTTVNGRDIRGMGDQPIVEGDFITLGDRYATFRIQAL